MAKKSISKTTIIKNQNHTNLLSRKNRFKNQKRLIERVSNVLTCKNTILLGLGEKMTEIFDFFYKTQTTFLT